MARRPATTDEEVAKFRRDAAWLTKTHLSGKIAEKLGVGSANFSSYVKGSKRPGKNILKKFYNLQEMQNAQNNTQDAGDNKKIPDYEHGGLKSGNAEDAQGRYVVDLNDAGELTKELFRTYKMNNANCWSSVHETIITGQMWAKSHEEAAKGSTIYARIMEKLLDKVLAVDGDSAAT